MADLSEFSLVLASFHAASDGAAEGGQISTALNPIPPTKDGFFYAITANPSGQGTKRRFMKMFLTNKSTITVSSAKLWISTQEKSPQIKIALERTSAGIIARNYSTFINTPESLPPGLSLGHFTLAPSIGVALEAGGTGSLNADENQGIWVMQELLEGIIGDVSVPVKFGLTISE